MNTRKQSSHSTTDHPTRHFFENLEVRQFLSAGHAGLTDGVLKVTGTSKNDHISIVVDKTHKQMLDVTVDGTTHKFARSRIARMRVSGGAGNDVITVGSAVTTPAVLDGGAGDDSMSGGGGTDTLKGDAGDDTLAGGNGHDHIDGGTGDDHCDFGPKSGVPLAQLPQVVQDGLTALAQGATIGNVQTFQDNGETFYGTVVTISGVKTRIVVGADGTPVTKGADNGGGDDHHHEDSNAFGSVVSVDVGANTITISIGSEHAAPQPKTFTLADGAVITADGATATLADLAAGTWVHVISSPSDPTIATAISAIGKRAEGTVSAVDTGANTLSLTTDESNTPQTFNVDSNTKIKVNGVTATLSQVTVGMEVHLALSSVDSTLAVNLQAEDSGQDGGHGGGDGGDGGDNGPHPGGDDNGGPNKSPPGDK